MIYVILLFTIHTWFYRTSPSQFVIPLAKFHKAMYTQVSVGMRFGMMFETDESSKRRFLIILLFYFFAFPKCIFHC